MLFNQVYATPTRIKIIPPELLIISNSEMVTDLMILGHRRQYTKRSSFAIRSFTRVEKLKDTKRRISIIAQK